MKRTRIVALAVAAAMVGWSASAQTIPAHVAAAVGDAARPEADRVRDDARKPAEMLAFAGVQPGHRIGELLPGAGYFTRVLSKAVGAQGRVYTVVPPQASENAASAAEALASAPEYGNITLVRQAPASFSAPEPLDLVWTSLNYHDMYNGGQIAEVNQAVFNALKPGGIYLVIDHAAPASWGATATQTHHRIARETVMRQVQAAGFELDGENWALWNPTDAGLQPVSAWEGRTNQFALRFRKPE